MNYRNAKMKVGIVYTSVTGNTENLAKLLADAFRKQSNDVFLYKIEVFNVEWVNQFDVFVIGTYTWGRGEIPNNMKALYQNFQTTKYPNLITGIFGTGDRFFPQFCGAVDRFRDLLKHQTRLAVTLKVEFFPQYQDKMKCVLFVKKCKSYYLKFGGALT